MTTKTDLRAMIREFDRRSPSALTEARAKLGGAPDYHAALVALFDDGEAAVSSGATWLIRYELENGWTMPQAAATAISKRLSKIAIWDAQLHLCQSVHMMPLSPAARAAWRDWLTPLLDNDRPFVRAWALSALCHLGSIDRKIAPAAKAALDRMRDDPAASVRARVRNLSK